METFNRPPQNKSRLLPAGSQTAAMGLRSGRFDERIALPGWQGSRPFQDAPRRGLEAEKAHVRNREMVMRAFAGVLV
jgi:hypothetical protein